MSSWIIRLWVSVSTAIRPQTKYPWWTPAISAGSTVKSSLPAVVPPSLGLAKPKSTVSVITLRKKTTTEKSGSIRYLNLSMSEESMIKIKALQAHHKIDKEANVVGRAVALYNVLTEEYPRKGDMLTITNAQGKTIIIKL